VELDDVRLSRDDVGLVVNVVPSSQFVLSSRERVLWEEGPAFPLGGLDEGSAFALIERRLGRALTAEEQPDARALVAAVGGLPLELVKAASRVRDEGAPLREVAAAAAHPSPAVVDAASLIGDEERVQAGAAGGGGAALIDDLLAAAAELPDTAALDEALEQRA
jgi:hypothetical protein